MKKSYSLILYLFFLVVLLSSCEKEKYEASSKEISVVSRFVYDGMSALYLWNDELADKKPTYNDTDAKKYFKNLLNETARLVNDNR